MHRRRASSIVDGEGLAVQAGLQQAINGVEKIVAMELSMGVDPDGIGTNLQDLAEFVLSGQ
jgi:hypothetical protein